MRLGSQRQLARELGCAPNHINELCKKKDYRIVKVGNKVDLDESTKRLIEAGFGKKTKKKKPAKKKPAAKAPQKKDEPKDNDSNDSTIPELDESADRQDLERIKTYEQARKLRIDNDKQSEKLVDKKETQDKWFEIARTVRDSLETIPGNVSGLLIGKTKHQIEQILVKEIKRTLFNLKEEIE